MTLVVSCRAERRLARWAEWAAPFASDQRVVVVAATFEGARERVRAETQRRGATFGWTATTASRFAAGLAQYRLAERGWTPAGRLACEAVVARAVDAASHDGQLGRLEDLAETPGFVRALAATLDALRADAVPLDAVRAETPEVAQLLERYEESLQQAGLADRAAVFQAAVDECREPTRRVEARDLLRVPVSWVDVPLATRCEEAFVAEVVAAAPDVFATIPTGDAALATRWEALLHTSAQSLDAELPDDARSLERLQAHLFERAERSPRPCDESVAVVSAPGESRECVELARSIQACAEEGVAFDRVAVILRSTADYRAPLADALQRAAIPFHVSRGAARPDPSGRAFLSLLHCAREQLSARRFAESLSSGQVPDAAADGTPPTADASAWAPPDHEFVTDAVRAALQAVESEANEEDAAPTADDAVRDGGLRAPRRWEHLLVESSVIGGLDRWRRRLSGLQSEFERALAAVDDPDSPEAERLSGRLSDLDHLRRYAMPLLEALDALPDVAAWSEWIDRLSALASRAIRRPARILATLAELVPMRDIGEVGLREVTRVLSERLLMLPAEPDPRVDGKVAVLDVNEAWGRSFDVVFIPGLAERMFPQRLREDPLLLDDVRAAVDEHLPRRADRIRLERRALHVAVGAATRRVVLSYPRLDLERRRPRVPSFYALEAVRAAEGELPGIDAFTQRARGATKTRVGWPAPESPHDAIDEAEYDLALLSDLLARAPEETEGEARYLLQCNPHLGRALRARASRWLRGWTPADGLLKPSDAARAVMGAHQLSTRSFSPTALQRFAACPYQFFLYAVHRLQARDEPEAIEEMDPLQRGSLVHDAQFAWFTKLQEEGLLPLEPGQIGELQARLDDALDEVAAQAKDDLFPAIDRVWDDSVAALHADLREWLRRRVEHPDGFEPHRFEWSFGLRGRRLADPHSVEDPVALSCGIALRGSIDLVERHPVHGLRATDHKTGRAQGREGDVIRGGASLQPLLYALALEAHEDAAVAGGRLDFCTTKGGFTTRDVPLDESTREAADVLAQVVGGALEKGWFPALPQEGACRYCDYKTVCGPFEEARTRRKRKTDETAALSHLRSLS